VHQWVKPRSLLLHLAFLLIVAGCAVAAYWQIHRAIQGNLLSYTYSVEWPFFAVVAGIGWWQMVHDTPEDIAARKAYHARMRAASAAVVARTLPRSARSITVTSEDLAAPALDPGSAGALTPGAVGGSFLVPRRGAEMVPASADRDLEAVLLEAEDADVDPDDQLAAYNRYLAMLALHGKPKTWRNPRGI
jgi:hypothetical protein